MRISPRRNAPTLGLPTLRLASASLVLCLYAVGSEARAQSAGSGSGTGSGSSAPPGPAAGAAPAPGPTNTTTTTVVTPFGYPAPGTKIDPQLPSSSRASSDTSHSTDGFDLVAPSSGVTLHGNSDAAGVFEPSFSRVPGAHVVRRGDTLWDICGAYFHNPWQWPRIWSYNPQLQNPHWIYPGDHIHLRNDGGDDRGTQTLGLLTNRRPQVPKDTVFLRDQGFVDDARRDVWGSISGSPDDRMLLATGNQVYLEIGGDHEPKPNQELTIFNPVRDVASGSVVQILGTVRVLDWDKDKRIAKGQIIEALDAVERGARVGPLGRKFDVVPPVRNKGDISARVIVSIYPLVFHAQNQVVYIDKGADDGLAPGNRLFILRRGDPWRATLSGSGDLSDKTVKNTAELGVETRDVHGTERDRDYPDEVVGELRVLRVREKSAACLVTNSKSEIVSGDLAIARKGY